MTLGIVEYLLSAGAIVVLSGYIWHRLVAQINGIEELLRTKAPLDSVKSVESEVKKVADTCHTLELQNTAIKSQVERTASHLESERGTRERVDDAILAEVKAAESRMLSVLGEMKVDMRGIRDGLVQYGRRDSDRRDDDHRRSDR